jgi:hypothetical protein
MWKVLGVLESFEESCGEAAGRLRTGRLQEFTEKVRGGRLRGKLWKSTERKRNRL